MTTSSQWTIAGLCALILGLIITGIILYIKELNKIMNDEPYN